VNEFNCQRLRSAFTHIELLATMAILLDFLRPASQKVLESAARTKCANALRQVVLAAHTAHAVTQSPQLIELSSLPPLHRVGQAACS
jgi:hypothetical protein